MRKSRTNRSGNLLVDTISHLKKRTWISPLVIKYIRTKYYIAKQRVTIPHWQPSAVPGARQSPHRVICGDNSGQRLQHVLSDWLKPGSLSTGSGERRLLSFIRRPLFVVLFRVSDRPDRKRVAVKIVPLILTASHAVFCAFECTSCLALTG